jgi:hypothetical protein
MGAGAIAPVPSVEAMFEPGIGIGVMFELAKMLLAALGPLGVAALVLTAVLLALARPRASIRPTTAAGRRPTLTPDEPQPFPVPPVRADAWAAVEEPPPPPARREPPTPWSLVEALYAIGGLNLPPPRPCRRVGDAAAGLDELVDRVSARLINRVLAEQGFLPGSRIWEEALPAARLAAAYAADPDRADRN